MIRKIIDSDRQLLYQIIKNKFGVEYKNDSVYTNWYIYEIENEIVGFINYDIIYDRSEIEYIYVKEEYRNMKIATQLLNKMIDELNERNIKSITLEVRSKNKQAISFYKKNDFETISVRKRYYSNDDAILMLKRW